MKLATRTGDFFKYTNSQTAALEHIKKAGFRYADYSFGCDYQTQSGVYGKEYETHLQAVKNTCEKLGVTYDSDSLLLPTRKRRRIYVCLVLKTDSLKQSHSLLLTFFLVLLFIALLFAVYCHRCKHNIFKNGFIVKEIKLLENHSHTLSMKIYIGFGVGKVFAVKNYIAARRSFE